MRGPSPWAELSETLRRAPELRQLLDRLGRGGACATRLPVPAAAWVGELCAAEAGRPLLVVVPHESEARAWLEALRLVTGRDAGASFPAPSLSPYQEVETSLQVRAEEVVALDRAASGEASALVTTPRALFRRLPDPAGIPRLELGAGDEVEPERFAARLVELGYRRVDLVSEVGDFAVRGGVLDLWSPGAPEPARLDLVGSESESVRRFDPETQR